MTVGGGEGGWGVTGGDSVSLVPAGAVKVTPGHSSPDLALARAHGLPLLSVIGDDGTMCPPRWGVAPGTAIPGVLSVLVPPRSCLLSPSTSLCPSPGPQVTSPAVSPTPSRFPVSPPSLRPLRPCIPSCVLCVSVPVTLLCPPITVSPAVCFVTSQCPFCPLCPLCPELCPLSLPSIPSPCPPAVSAVTSQCFPCPRVPICISCP